MVLTQLGSGQIVALCKSNVFLFRLWFKRNFRRLWKPFWHWRYGNCYIFNSGTSETGEIQEILTIDDPGPNNGKDKLQANP